MGRLGCQFGVLSFRTRQSGHGRCVQLQYKLDNKNQSPIQSSTIKAPHFCERKLCLLSVFENARAQWFGIRQIDKPNIETI